MGQQPTDICVEITCQMQIADDAIGQLEKLIRGILGQFDAGSAQININVVDDDGIIDVNQRFLDRTTATDVISFDLSESDDGQKTFDIVVNADQAQRQADQRGHSQLAELALYVTHGMLHNLGFDDATEEQSQKMHSMEDQILQKAGFGVVYKK